MMGLTSLYLLSALGVEGDPNDMIFNVGGMGTGSAGIAILIGARALSRTHYEHQQSGSGLVVLRQASRDSRFSIGDMSSEMGGIGF